MKYVFLFSVILTLVSSCSDGKLFQRSYHYLSSIGSTPIRPLICISVEQDSFFVPNTGGTYTVVDKNPGTWAIGQLTFGHSDKQEAIVVQRPDINHFKSWFHLSCGLNSLTARIEENNDSLPRYLCVSLRKDNFFKRIYFLQEGFDKMLFISLMSKEELDSALDPKNMLVQRKFVVK